jgi:hypothetical protein
MRGFGGWTWSAEGLQSEETACSATVEADGDPTKTQAKRGRSYSAVAASWLSWTKRNVGLALRHGRAPPHVFNRAPSCGLISCSFR